jgi:hypothetical protein
VVGEKITVAVTATARDMYFRNALPDISVALTLPILQPEQVVRR